jgi:hypothetical protein
VIGVYDEAGNVIETHEHKGEFALFPRAGRLSLGKIECSNPKYGAPYG